jgi:hypothetical protein
MWQEEKAGMAVPSELSPPEEIADGMLELCENEAYGDGTILEVLKNKTRVVPLYNADPPKGDGLVIGGWGKHQDEILETLKQDGLKV